MGLELLTSLVYTPFRTSHHYTWLCLLEFDSCQLFAGPPPCFFTISCRLDGHLVSPPDQLALGSPSILFCVRVGVVALLLSQLTNRIAGAYHFSVVAHGLEFYVVNTFNRSQLNCFAASSLNRCLRFTILVYRVNNSSWTHCHKPVCISTSYVVCSVMLSGPALSGDDW
jgi:hypothetical protein